MHSPHRWSEEWGESVKGLPHPGQRGDMTQGIFSQHSRHQDLRGWVSILWQPAQLLGRHKSTRTEPANFNPDPIEPSADRKADHMLSASSSTFRARLSKTESFIPKPFGREYTIAQVDRPHFLVPEGFIGHEMRQVKELLCAGQELRKGRP